jgi:cytoskeleton protein RodZ
MERSLANTLHETREARGMSIDDAVIRSKIPRPAIEAMEGGDLGYFTSPLYARSFLKQYGEFLELDLSDWLDGLIPTSMIESNSSDSIIRISEALPFPQKKEQVQKPPGGGNIMPTIWLIVITAALVWGGVWLFQDMNRKYSDRAPVTPTPSGN